MRQLTPGVWVVEQPLLVFGIDIGCRATVIRLQHRALWVHAPVRLTPELQAALGREGEVRYLVAPNLYHHLFLRGWLEVFPKAELHGAPGLPVKRDRLPFSAELGDAPPAAWRDEIDQRCLRGLPEYNEVAFFHRATRTLLLTDTCFQFGAEHDWRLRLGARLLGVYERLAYPWLWARNIEDRAAWKTSARAVLDWDFDRLIFAHGRIVETGGKAALARAWARTLA